jgi:hypothetical protein
MFLATAGQGPMDGGATRQRGDEREDELPDGDATPSWTGVEAAGDGSCKKEEVMKHGSDTKTEEERG